MVIKINKKSLIIIFLYILFFVPYIYSIYYSMPATDDYAWAIEWFSTNRLVEVMKRVQWNYMNWFGQSGVFAVVIQILFNPLYWFKDKGHSFGICMVIVYFLIVVGLICAIKGLAKSLLKIEDDFVRSIFTFLVIALLFTTYYYNDVYNWWSGTPGYSMMMVVMLFCMKNISEYANEQLNKHYIKMVLLGMIACTGLMNCVAIGLFYFYKIIFNKKCLGNAKKNIVPFAFYVISGIFTVVAPGNYRRTDSYDKDNVDYIGSIGVTIYTVITRAINTLIKYPWTLAIFIIIILIASLLKKTENGSIKKVFICTVLITLAAIGALYPYVAGERKQIGEEFAPRAFFITDYIMFIGFAFVAFELGRWLSCRFDINMTKNKIAFISTLVILISVITAKVEGTLMYIVQYDIYRQRTQIVEIYNVWEDIIEEIQTSTDNEIIIKKENVPWTRFSYPVGIDSGEYSRIEDNLNFYGNVNQCTQIWYTKDIIKVYID